jgi:hypothetical protein
MPLTKCVTTQGPLWGYLKVNFSETLSIFGDKYPRSGSKNGEMAPRTETGYPHIGPFVERVADVLRAFRCRENVEHRGQSKPDSGLDLSHFQCESHYLHERRSLAARQRSGGGPAWASVPRVGSTSR